MRLSKDDILSALGLETKKTNYADMFLMFGAGILAGAGIGLLLAPKTGVEMRQDVMERAGGLKGKATDLVSNVRGKIMNRVGHENGMSTGV